jgi:hypothetical protein
MIPCMLLHLIYHLGFVMSNPSPASSPQSQVTFSCLSANGKRIFNRFTCWAVVAAGMAVSERPAKTSLLLHSESTAEYKRIVNSSDIALMCRDSFRTDSPTAEEEYQIKVLARDLYESDVKKVNA